MVEIIEPFSPEGPIKPGDQIEIDGRTYNFPDESALQYNRWVAIGKPLPFVYVPLVNVEGTKHFIHVTKIDKVLIEIEKGEDTPDQ